VIDAAGNLFGISHSQDNVAPYYDHIAIFKINKTNGKRIWMRRFGLEIVGDEYCAGLDVFVGNGPIFAATFSDGAGGLNSRTWRLDNAGNTMWIKTVNSTGPGTIEAVSALGICPASGDVNIAGYRSSTNTHFMARYNATTGAAVWPLEVYTGVHSGETTNQDMDIDFSADGDIYLGYVVQSGPNASHVVTKYEQLVLKENTLPVSTDVMVYPNPASTFIQITQIQEKCSFQLLNNLGQNVLQGSLEARNTYLDIASLHPGQYFLRVQLNNGFQTIPFIKQ